jgi:hypothetical protein
VSIAKDPDGVRVVIKPFGPSQAPG